MKIWTPLLSTSWAAGCWQEWRVPTKTARLNPTSTMYAMGPRNSRPYRRRKRLIFRVMGCPCIGFANLVSADLIGSAGQNLYMLATENRPGRVDAGTAAPVHPALTRSPWSRERTGYTEKIKAVPFSAISANSARKPGLWTLFFLTRSRWSLEHDRCCASARHKPWAVALFAGNVKYCLSPARCAHLRR